MREMSPRELLTPLRLDYVVKHRFFRHLISGDDPDAERVYRWHILKRTNGNEPHSEKNSIEDYLVSCQILLDSLMERGFQPRFGLYYRPNLLLRTGGAHRLAASLALGINIRAQAVNCEGGQTWDYGWFARSGMNRDDLDRLMNDWRRLESSDQRQSHDSPEESWSGDQSRA